MGTRAWAWALGLCVSTTAGAAAPEGSATAAAQVGEALFFDERLSSPSGQSCASCHAPEAGFADPASGRAISEGAVRGRFGARNAPSAAYARFIPPFGFDPKEEHYVGGLFHDGRAHTLEEQAGGPLLNPLEMNNASKAEVVVKVRAAPYAPQLLKTFGPRALDDVEGGFAVITRALAAFERTPRFAPFSSRYDASLAGRVRLSPKEAEGLALFNDPKKGNCAACHPSTPSEDGTPPLFTDFTYDNLGVPRDPRSGSAARDLGLGGVLGAPAENGKFRVPTLRNVALTAPYMHNGVFETLEEVVRFYSTRDTQPWPAAEYPETVNREELGNLGLTEEEQGALVAFLRTLTDGWRP